MERYVIQLEELGMEAPRDSFREAVAEAKREEEEKAKAEAAEGSADAKESEPVAAETAE